MTVPQSRPGSRTPLRALSAALAVGLPALLALGACSGGAGEQPEPSPSASANQTAEPAEATSTPLAVPAGVTLTEPGTDLAYGDPATVAFPLEGDEVGVLEMRVDAVTEVSQRDFRGWTGSQALEESRPYFVQVRLANEGDTDLGGHDVPLHLVDDNDTLGPPWAFDGRFKPCQSGPLPTTFEPGDKTRMCLVYLAPMRAHVESMAFVPDADAEAVSWSGRVTTPKSAQRAPTKDQGRPQRRR